MKNLLSILLYLVVVSTLFPQSIKFGWITDTHVGFKNADQELESIVKSINQNEEIQFIVATGDITEKGTNNELESAKNVLDKLNKPYLIIPGNHDTKWSESGCTKFIELWGDDKFIFNKDSLVFIGLNSGIPWRGGGGHIAPDDLVWLEEQLEQTEQNSKVYFFVHHPLDKTIDNWFKVTNILRDYNIKAIFHGHDHENKLHNFNKIPAVMSRAAISKGKKGWGYNVVTIDSLFIRFNEAGPEGINKEWASIDKSKEFSVPFEKENEFKSFSITPLWQHNFKSTMSTELLLNADKIYSVTELGNDQSKITCFDTSGTIIWQIEEYGIIKSRPAVEDNILAVATLNGDLYTYDAATGNPLQSIGFDEPITSQLITINYEGSKKLMIPKETDSDVALILGTASGKLYCYDLETLEEIWINQNAAGMIETEPLFYKNKIIYGAWDGYLYNIDAKTGLLNWKWRGSKSFYYSPAACKPVTNGKNVYIVSPDKNVTAIDLLLGGTVWQEKKYGAWESIGISDIGHRLFIKGYKNRFHILSAKTGKWVKEIKLKGGIDTMPVTPIEWKNNILFGTKDGNVYSINKNFKLKKLFNMGSCRVHSIKSFENGFFAASNMDGKIIYFKID